MKGFDQEIMQAAKPEDTLDGQMNSTTYILDTDYDNYFIVGRCQIEDEGREFNPPEPSHRFQVSAFVKDRKTA
jgi:hypothetical protein